MRIRTVAFFATLYCLSSLSSGFAADWGMKEGNPEIKSAGSLAFGPDGILFVGDTKAAAVFAISTGDTKGKPESAKVQLDGLNNEVGKLLKTTGDNVTINDLATNPLTGNVFLSITKGKGAEATPAIVRISEGNKLNDLDLKKIPFQKVALTDAPEDKEVSRNGRTFNPRDDAITDLAYAEGKVFISGTANGNTPSSVHQVPFPFSDGAAGTGVEIFHGAHGRLETNATIRTFVPMNINGEPSLLAGFVCTPLVKFPVSNLKPAEKTRGTTVAELGNRNRPLDMIVYQKDGKNFLLLSNNPRGVMKISTENIARNDGITEPVTGGGTAGQTFETIKDLQGVVQLDRLNDEKAVVLIQGSDGSQNLKTVDLP